MVNFITLTESPEHCGFKSVFLYTVFASKDFRNKVFITTFGPENLSL